MDVGRMNNNRKQIAHGIRYNVPFSTLRFFPPSMPRSSLAAMKTYVRKAPKGYGNKALANTKANK
jgi:hypothetical protein